MQQVPDALRTEMSYTITLEKGDHRVVLTATDTTMSREFSALLDWLEQHFADA
jgi:hypothetical protein